MNLCSFLSILASYTRLYLSVCCLSTLSASRTSDCCLATHILLCHSQTPSYNTKIPLSAASSKHFSPCSWCATTLLLNSLASTKGHLIQDLLVHRKFDSLCLTETWQQPGNFSQLKSTNPLPSRGSGWGGDLAIIRHKKWKDLHRDLGSFPQQLAGICPCLQLL